MATAPKENFGAVLVWEYDSEAPLCEIDVFLRRVREMPAQFTYRPFRRR